MAIGRKRAMQRLEALAPLVEQHLAKVAADPTSEHVMHWRKEIAAWLEQMDAAAAHVGKRTGALWLEKIAEWRNQLEKDT